MGDDTVNQFLGRKPLAVDLSGIGAGEWLTWDTFELVAGFDILVGTHLVIDLISFSSPSGDAGNQITFAFDFIDDTEEDPRADLGLVADELRRTGRGIAIHVINAANTAVAMLPVDVYNTLAIQDLAGSTDSVVMFWFHLEPDGMDWSQENRVVEVIVRQIEDLQGDPGDQYFEVDYVDKIYLGGN